ncbi:hypothetical protein BCV70DRAFT_230921 [Testicularia cyperi]|uniref:Uncharacterized protein n=1 Tax=Testicularia cyperi TaxID=1882483 RepID=A0A317XRX6_9BASI|nr:hypothetical protein BCV70DRAFT_230921 [Testicularia cyperi]
MTPRREFGLQKHRTASRQTGILTSELCTSADPAALVGAVGQRYAKTEAKIDASLRSGSREIWTIVTSPSDFRTRQWQGSNWLPHSSSAWWFLGVAQHASAKRDQCADAENYELREDVSDGDFCLFIAHICTHGHRPARVDKWKPSIHQSPKPAAVSSSRTAAVLHLLCPRLEYASRSSSAAERQVFVIVVIFDGLRLASHSFDGTHTVIRRWRCHCRKRLPLLAVMPSLRRRSGDAATAVATKIGLVALIWLSLLALVSRADLELSYSVSQQCTPLNITWTPTTSGYPYTIWIMGNRGFVDAYRINSDYQPGATSITFQFVVPAPTSGFNSFVVAVADANGNGNSTRPLGISTPSGSSSSCDPYTATQSWQWAGDATDGNMVPCGNVRFYNIGDRGTRPFTISWVPIQGTPITVQVPDRYATNISTFVYNSNVPFSEGTQFQIVAGDTVGGGSGGASEIYTVGSGGNSSCLSNSGTLQDAITTRALPLATNVATFRGLKGAISTSAATNSGSKGGGGGNVGAIAGGAIGGAIALGVAIGCLIAFLLFRKRQKAKREQARREEDRFVDLDEDFVDSDNADSRRPGQHGAGVSQSYGVSPFVYEATGSDDGAQHPHQSVEMMSRTSGTHSWGGDGMPLSQQLSQSPHSPLTNPSYGELLTAAGIGMARSPSDSQSGAGANSNQSHGSQQAMLPPHDPLAAPQPVFRGVDSRRASSGSGILRLANTDDAEMAAAAELGSSQEAGPLPSKQQMQANQGGSGSRGPGSSRRVVVHADGGPLPQPTSDDEDEEHLDELPPQYGGWLDSNNNSANPSAGGSNQGPTSSSSRPY